MEDDDKVNTQCGQFIYNDIISTFKEFIVKLLFSICSKFVVFIRNTGESRKGQKAIIIKVPAGTEKQYPDEQSENPVAKISRKSWIPAFAGMTSYFCSVNFEQLLFNVKSKSSILLLVTMILYAGCMEGNVENGNTSLRLGDYPAAIRFYNAELQSHPDSYNARLGLAKAVIQKSVEENGDTMLWKEGLMHLEAARTLSPVEDATEISNLLSEAWLYHARALLTFKDTVGALSAISRSIEYNPGNIEPLNLAGIVYFGIGDSRKSIALLRKATLIDSTSPSPWFNLGMIFWQSGDVKSAHSHWMSALKLAPKDEDILYWFALAEKKLREME